MLFDIDLALQQRVVILSRERQARSDCCSNALLVKHPHSIRLHSEVKVQIGTVHDSAARGYCSASYGALELSDIQSVSREGEYTITITQAHRHASLSKTGVDDSNLSLQAGIRTRAV